MSRRFGDLGAPSPSLAGALEVAHVYALAGRWDEAHARLEAAYAADSTSAAAMNGLAVVAAAEGDPAAAEHWLRRATAADPADAGLALNLGLVRYVRGDTVAAAAPLARGLDEAGGLAPALALLDLDADAGADDAARLLLIDVLQRAAGSGTSPEGAARKAIGGEGAGRPAAGRMRNSAVRAEAARRIHEFMYWKK